MLRSFLTARNLFAFRNMNRSENAVIDGLAVAPTSLPSGGGYCFANSGGRMTMGRVAWAEDLGEWVRSVPAAVLDGDTAAAVLPFQPVQGLSPQARWETQTAKLAAWRRTTTGAELPSPSDAAPVVPAVPSSAPVPVVALPGWSGVAVPSALTAADVVSVPAPAAETVASAEGAEHAGLSSAQREVYAALAAGHTRTGDIAAVTGRKAPAVSKALTALASAGLAVKTGRCWTVSTGSVGAVRVGA
ncbi:hypothetical protein [Pseudonocardia sp. ICBG1142]|uniref:hypothetical protein n=1 Tax=Pseudonocardia sp. ICBG1142 TaxID=2846760 RepID=UPI001CF69811|nr:hypothetical protein [Pseudonocardia sp. ICBG1142]